MNARAVWTLVDLETASTLTGYRPRTLAKLYGNGKIAGERRLARRGRHGRTYTCLFVSVASIQAYERWLRTSRKRASACQLGVLERELVCLECAVPDDCDEDDPRCVYRHG